MRADTIPYAFANFWDILSLSVFVRTSSHESEVENSEVHRLKVTRVQDIRAEVVHITVRQELLC